MGEEAKKSIEEIRAVGDQIQALGEQALEIQREQNRRFREQVDAQIRAGDQQREKMLDDLRDPLRMPVERESDIEFLPSGQIDPKTLRRVIL